MKREEEILLTKLLFLCQSEDGPFVRLLNTAIRVIRNNYSLTFFHGFCTIRIEDQDVALRIIRYLKDMEAQLDSYKKFAIETILDNYKIRLKDRRRQL